MHTYKYICFCRDFRSFLPALLLPVPPFPAWQQGLAGKRGAESPGMCIHLSCSLLLEVEDKAQGARQGGLPPEGRAEICKRAGVLPLDLSWLCSRENHVSEKSWQHRWLPPAPQPWTTCSALGPPASESRLSCTWSWPSLPTFALPLRAPLL